MIDTLPVAEGAYMSDDAEETDSNGESTSVELKLEQQLPHRRISLTMGEQAVEVVATDELETVAEVAAKLWLLTTPPKSVRIGFGAGETLYTERSHPEQGEQDEQVRR